MKRNRMPLLMRRAYGDDANPTRTVVDLKFDEVYVVIIGSGTGRPHVITRYAPVSWLDSIRPTGVPCDAGHSKFIDCIKAVYDGEVYRIRFFAIDADGNPAPRVIPCLGYSTMKWKAEEYADELYRVMQHHTNLHYPTDIVSEHKHTGKHTYCRARRGLWTRHFPTWKCLLALTVMRNAVESMPLQLELWDDSCEYCRHWECPDAGRPDTTRCKGYDGIEVQLYPVYEGSECVRYPGHEGYEGISSY